MILWQASLESRNFDFEGYGTSEEAAINALIRALHVHAAQYHIDPNWWLEDKDGFETRKVGPGMIFRDRQPI